MAQRKRPLIDKSTISRNYPNTQVIGTGQDFDDTRDDQSTEYMKKEEEDNDDEGEAEILKMAGTTLGKVNEDLSSSYDELPPMASVLPLAPNMRPVVNISDREAEIVHSWSEEGMNLFEAMVPQRLHTALFLLQENLAKEGYNRSMTELMHLIRQKHDEKYQKYISATDDQILQWRLDPRSTSESVELLQQHVYQLRMDMRQCQFAWSDKMKSIIIELYTELNDIQYSEKPDGVEKLCGRMRARWKDFLK